MVDCWNTKPLLRPSFTKIGEVVGCMLEQSVLMHYIRLNDPYLQMNTKIFENNQNDYLKMTSPPDFAELSSPNYVNDDDSGISSPTPGQAYLTMRKPVDIFSPRAVGSNVFRFSEEGPSAKEGGTELAPMLDLEGNDNLSKPNSPVPGELPSYSNPTYNKFPLMKPQEIVKTNDNYVNMPQNKNSIKSDMDRLCEKSVPNHYVNSSSRDWAKDAVQI